MHPSIFLNYCTRLRVPSIKDQYIQFNHQPAYFSILLEDLAAPMSGLIFKFVLINQTVFVPAPDNIINFKIIVQLQNPPNNFMFNVIPGQNEVYVNYAMMFILYQDSDGINHHFMYQFPEYDTVLRFSHNIEEDVHLVITATHEPQPLAKIFLDPQSL